MKKNLDNMAQSWKNNRDEEEIKKYRNSKMKWARILTPGVCRIDKKIFEDIDVIISYICLRFMKATDRLDYAELKDYLHKLAKRLKKKSC